MKHYETGNAFFLKNRFDDAFNSYSNGLLTLSLSSEMTLKLLLNRSLCALKLRLYDCSIKDSNSVLELDPQNVKALARRAQAYEYRGDFARSLRDISELLSLESASTLHSSSVVTKRRLEQLVCKDNISLREGGVPEKLISQGQALRLMFCQSPPRTALLSTKFTFQVCIANEFGLWNRAHLKESNLENLPEIVVALRCVDISCEPTSVTGVSFDAEVSRLGADGKVFNHLNI